MKRVLWICSTIVLLLTILSYLVSVYVLQDNFFIVRPQSLTIPLSHKNGGSNTSRVIFVKANNNNNNNNGSSLLSNFFTKRSTKVNAYVHKSLINEVTLCTKDTRLLIIVLSAPGNAPKRKFIRETWGHPKSRGTNVTVVFLTAKSFSAAAMKSIAVESKQFHDVLQDDFLDAYKALPKKTIMGLRWASRYCNGAKYVMKTDDDMVINIPKLNQILATEKSELFGASAGGSRVMRKGKWAISEKDFPFPSYMPYLSGAAYVMSIKVAKLLSETAEYVPQIHLEDVYVTGILAKVAGISPTGVIGFPLWISRGKKIECMFINKEIIGIHCNGVKLCQNLWGKLKTSQKC